MNKIKWIRFDYWRSYSKLVIFQKIDIYIFQKLSKINKNQSLNPENTKIGKNPEWKIPKNENPKFGKLIKLIDGCKKRMFKIYRRQTLAERTWH